MDLVGTLIHPQPPVAHQYHQAAQTLGSRCNLPSVNVIDRRFRTAFDHVDLPGYGLPYGQTTSEAVWYWKRILGSIFPRFSDNNLTRLTRSLYEQFGSASAWSLYPMARRVLNQIKATEAEIGLISNFDVRGPHLIRDLQLSDLFDKSIFSSEVGFEKPDPRIFRLSEARFGPSAERTIMVGNTVEVDLEVPDSMGWETILFNPDKNDCWETEVYSWDQIPDCL